MLNTRMYSFKYYMRTTVKHLLFNLFRARYLLVYVIVLAFLF